MSKWLFSTFLMFYCPFTQFWSYLTLPFSKFKRWCWYVHRRFHLLRLCPTRFANFISDKNVIWQQNCVDAHYIPFHMGSSWNVVKKKGQEANFYSSNSNMLPRIACLQCLNHSVLHRDLLSMKAKNITKVSYKSMKFWPENSLTQ